MRTVAEARRRAFAKSSLNQHLSGKNIVRTTRGFKNTTSIGLGLWAFYEIAGLDLSHLDKLGRRFWPWGEAVTMPGQSLMNLMAMIPDKTPGAMHYAAHMSTSHRLSMPMQKGHGRKWSRCIRPRGRLSQAWLLTLRAMVTRPTNQEFLR